MQIRVIKPKDVEAPCYLIMRTYRDFNYEEGTVEATEDYIKAYNPELNIIDLKERFSRTPICYVATERSEVVGVVRGSPGRLVNLFVYGEHHRKGIGLKLLHQFELHCQADGKDVIKTNVSIYSIPFYEANGYRKTTGVRNQKGLKIQPMKKWLTNA
jgi:GNAT superfamily N-acetyltransferase